VHCEAGILTAEEGHVQPGQPAQVGGASIVDREPCAEPGDRDGCEQGHDRKPVQTAVDHDDPRRLARLVGFLQKTRQRERCAETAGLARIGSDAALRGHEHQHVRFDPLAMVREDGARGFLIRRRRRRLQREVAREQSRGGDELLAAGLELPHEQVPASRSSSPISCRALARTAAATTRKHGARMTANSPTKTATSRPRKLRKLWKRTCQRASRAHATAVAPPEQPPAAIRLATDRRRAGKIRASAGEET